MQQDQAGGEDQPVNAERQQPRGCAGLPVRAGQVVDFSELAKPAFCLF